MLRRLHLDHIQSLLRTFPCVAIVGPRQCGKTTLARAMGGAYFDLEQEGDRVRLDARWHELVKGSALVILDEVQEAPELFSRLRSAVDLDRGRNGRFLLLGSVSPTLVATASQSLAGRVALFELSPFVLPEVGMERRDALWVFGAFPDGGILDERQFGTWQDSYLTLLAARDLPRWGLAANPRVTERLLRMLAALHGQTWNGSRVGAALSIDGKTATRHLDHLEGAFLIRRLPPFLPNIRKRLVRSPRVYWRDSGLLHAQLGVADLDTLLTQPWVGASWEGFVIEQTLSTLAALGRRARAHWFRSSDGYELDLVLEMGTQRWALEAKLTSNPSRAEVARLHKTADLIDAERRILICRVAEPITSPDLLVTHLADWTQVLQKEAP